MLVDERGQVLGVGYAGCSNWEVVDLDGAQAAFEQAVREAVANAGIERADIAAAGYGLAGLDWPSDEDRLGPVIDTLYLSGPRQMVNDAFLPLRAGTVDGVGLGAIAGTGTCVVGRNRAGELARSFGAGYPFTDWGGAGDIVGGAVHAIAAAYKGIGPETTLAGRMVAEAGCADVDELMEKLMRWQIQIDSQFAPQVFEAANEGDVPAQAIIRRAGTTIGANAVAVARRLGLLDAPFPLVTAGGVFSSQNKLLNDSLLEAMHVQGARVELTYWEAPPVVGAVLLGLDLLDLDVLPDTDTLAARVHQSLAT